ncbi:hypothetical protein RHSIM_Rhsim04G0018300 [Rhododendron simsii]|uniref:Transmembrane protein 184C n=1 Tax=Rhododendron simsii TaxID=118357 RepID=A0A834H088_RHOSS|nr:hypothetical protein RHSIM_Rhsim04G0018300 [Rhododendron simsii]
MTFNPAGFDSDFLLIGELHIHPKMNPEQLTLMGTTICVMLTMHFSVQLASEHIMHWTKPKEQKAIMVIILMAPIYAIDSFVGLLDFQGSKPFFMFLDSIKECYEALLTQSLYEVQPKTVRLNHRTLKLLKSWTWQFVVIRPVCSILMIALQLLGIYPSWVSWTFTIILNISVSLALYSLVLFYHVFAKELEPHKPLAKFLCIKGIVFFCFWQGILLDILAKLGVIKSHHFWLQVDQIEESLRNTLVCVEMVFFSAAMQYAYSVEPYRDDDASSTVKDKKRE